jgi:hypothetical protein
MSAMTLAGVIGMSTLAVGVANAAPPCKAELYQDGKVNPYSICTSGDSQQRLAVECPTLGNEYKTVYGQWAKLGVKSTLQANGIGVSTGCKNPSTQRQASGRPGRPQ